MASRGELREVLQVTSLPHDLVEALVNGASSLWLGTGDATTLAAELSLCHPPLADKEVRAVVRRSTVGGEWRLTVVAHDRVGLMACTTGVLADAGFSIRAANMTSWVEMGLALQSLVVGDPQDRAPEDADWDAVGGRLRAVLAAGEVPLVAWDAAGPVGVDYEILGYGRGLLTVDAPDRVGLLWAVSAWLAAQGVSIDVARVSSDGGRARDVFLVEGRVDVEALRTALAESGVPAVEHSS